MENILTLNENCGEKLKIHPKSKRREVSFPHSRWGIDFNKKIVQS